MKRASKPFKVILASILLLAVECAFACRLSFNSQSYNVVDGQVVYVETIENAEPLSSINAIRRNWRGNPTLLSAQNYVNHGVLAYDNASVYIYGKRLTGINDKANLQVLSDFGGNSHVILQDSSAIYLGLKWDEKDGLSPASTLPIAPYRFIGNALVYDEQRVYFRQQELPVRPNDLSVVEFVFNQLTREPIRARVYQTPEGAYLDYSNLWAPGGLDFGSFAGYLQSQLADETPEWARKIHWAFLGKDTKVLGWVTTSMLNECGRDSINRLEMIHSKDGKIYFNEKSVSELEDWKQNPMPIVRTSLGLSWVVNEEKPAEVSIGGLYMARIELMLAGRDKSTLYCPVKPIKALIPGFCQ